MKDRLNELAQRRLTLISRSGRLREQLAQDFRDLQKPLSFVRGVIGVIRALTAHPAVLMALTTLVLTSRQIKSDGHPKEAMGWRILRLLQAIPWGRLVSRWGSVKAPR